MSFSHIKPSPNSYAILWLVLSSVTEYQLKSLWYPIGSIALTRSLICIFENYRSAPRIIVAAIPLQNPPITLHLDAHKEHIRVQPAQRKLLRNAGS